MAILEYMTVYLAGSAAYGTLELLWRGWTHWTMLVVGGLCTCIMYWVANRTALPSWQKWVLTAVAITTVEYLSGLVINLYLRWDVWDYSRQPGNILGQICPAFFLIWLSISIPGNWLCRKLYRLLNQ